MFRFFTELLYLQGSEDPICCVCASDKILIVVGHRFLLHRNDTKIPGCKVPFSLTLLRLLESL